MFGFDTVVVPERTSAAAEIEDYVSYIARGIVRYYVAEDDKDITFEIAFENSLAAGYDSFLTRKPVLYNAEALVDMELWSLDYMALQAVYASGNVGEKLGRLAAEQLYIRKNKRQMSLLKDTAEQRYLQALSRIRRRVAGNSGTGN